MAVLSQSLLHLQAFMVIVAATTLILGSVSDERRHAIGLRDSLISLASHELRTPLTSLQLRVQLLARNARAPTLSRERFSRDAAGAEDQVKRMARLVDDLLDISRIMSGRLRLDVEDVDLGGFVHEVVDRYPEPQRELVGIKVEGEPIVGRWDRMRNRSDRLEPALERPQVRGEQPHRDQRRTRGGPRAAHRPQSRPRHRRGRPAADLRALRAGRCTPRGGLRAGPLDRPAGRRRARRDDRRREPPGIRLGVHRRASPRARPRRAGDRQLPPPRRQGLTLRLAFVARREERTFCFTLSSRADEAEARLGRLDGAGDRSRAARAPADLDSDAVRPLDHVRRDGVARQGAYERQPEPRPHLVRPPASAAADGPGRVARRAPSPSDRGRTRRRLRSS